MLLYQDNISIISKNKEYVLFSTIYALELLYLLHVLVRATIKGIFPYLNFHTMLPSHRL